MIDFEKYLIAEEGIGTQLFGVTFTPQKLIDILKKRLQKYSSNVRVISGQTYGDDNVKLVVGVNLSALDQKELAEINQIISNNHPVGIRVQKRMNHQQNTLEYHFI